LENNKNKIMFVIEIAGVFSSGKSTLINNISKNENVMIMQQILPIWFILKFLNEGVIQNIIIELYILFRYNFKIILNIKGLIYFDLSTMSLIEKIKLYRSAIRKLGYVYIVNKKRKKYHGKILLIDEGFYQIVQNSVSSLDVQSSFIDLFKFEYEPDLLIITVASGQTIFNRSKLRKDLTGRYKRLPKKNLFDIINKSTKLFEILGKSYVNYFACNFINLNDSTLIDTRRKGLIFLRNDK
jgi:hypothetical protein